MSDHRDENPAIRFIADENVAKLGRWLRILGYDVAYETPTTDARLAWRAQREGRVLLTLDHDFCEMTVDFFMPKSRDPLSQVREVLEAFHLKPREQDLFTRCAECNVPVSTVSPDAVRDQVPPFVFQTRTRFHKCPSCGRVYWRGSHVELTLQRLRELGLLE